MENNRKQRLEVMTGPGVKGPWHKVGLGIPSQTRVKGRSHGDGSAQGSQGAARVSGDGRAPESLAERGPLGDVKVH